MLSTSVGFIDDRFMHVWRVLALSLAHFSVSMSIAAAAFGTDMDQLRSRSAWSRAAASVHDLLWLPHDAALRTVPHGWLIRNTYVIPLALVLNSLAWGVLLYALWRFVRGLRQLRSARA